MNQARKAICLSRGIIKQPFWQQLLGVHQAAYYGPLMRFFNRSLDGDAIIVDWGLKRQVAASKLATLNNKPLLRLEDGFVRSIGTGQNATSARTQAYSLIVDDIGIYYDANKPSRLENILLGTAVNALPFADAARQDQSLRLDDRPLLGRARQCIKTITENNLSKYNDSDELELGIKDRYRVLVVDQVCDDLSIIGANASAATFTLMLKSALQTHPKAEIIIKIHPASAQAKTRHYSQQSVDWMVAEQSDFSGQVKLLQNNCNPLALLKQIDEVYVVSSQMGFEALMLNKKVVCYGLPFYAGWGLTEDRQQHARRNKLRSVEQIFAAAYLIYSHYFDPLTDSPCELEVLLDFFIRQRQQFERNRGSNLCLGFPPWKRGYVSRFLFSPWGQTLFFNRQQDLINYLSIQSDHDTICNNRVVLWGGNAIDLADQNNKVKETVRVEDGFIRSVGLGKYYIPPVSLVFDTMGIYYDPAIESDLEKIIGVGNFSDEQLQLALRLQEKLITTGVTKYNVGHEALPKQLVEAKRAGKKIIFVPGQVEDDASISASCEKINHDLALIEAVKEKNRDPTTLILYKPHPDVVSGHSWSRKNSSAIERLADFSVKEVNMHDCLAIADEVHTMSSLAGFEALLRGKLVFTYGRPFYAGWGLTFDSLPIPRRNRKVTLPELITAVLIIYPRYIDYRQGFFISAEQALEGIILLAESKQGNGSVVQVSQVSRRFSKFRHFINGLLYGLRLK